MGGYSNKYNIMRIDFKWYNEVHHKAELRTRRGDFRIVSHRRARGWIEKKNQTKNHEVNSNSTAE